MNRLIRVNYNERTESFTYDLVGNCLRHTVNDENTIVMPIPKMA